MTSTTERTNNAQNNCNQTTINNNDSSGWLGRSWQVVTDSSAWVTNWFNSPVTATDAPAVPSLSERIPYSNLNSGTFGSAFVEGAPASGREEYKLPPKPAPIWQNALSKRLRKLSVEVPRGPTCGAYLTTNESKTSQTRTALKGIPAPATNCHVGVSGLHNFDLIVQRNSKRAMIFDLNPENEKIINTVLHYVRECPSKEAFVKAFKIYCDCLYGFSFSPNINKEFDHHLSTKDELKGELWRDGSWLSTNESYETIRELAVKDLIVAITLDIRSTDTIKRIHSILQNTGLEVDTLYVSNVGGWMESDQDKAQFRASVETLTANRTAVIYSYDDDELDELAQAVVLGSAVLKDSSQCLGKSRY